MTTPNYIATYSADGENLVHVGFAADSQHEAEAIADRMAKTYGAPCAVVVYAGDHVEDDESPR